MIMQCDVNKTNAYIWFENGDPFYGEVELKEDKILLINPENKQKDGIANVYLNIKDNYYPLGGWHFKNGIGKRPNYLKLENEAIKVEQSAINRINSLLQNKDGLTFFIYDENGFVNFAYNRKIEHAPQSPIFVLENDYEAEKLLQKTYYIVLELYGYMYSFILRPIETEGHKISAYLPSNISRILRRSLDRKMKGHIQFKMKAPHDCGLKLKDISPLGAGFYLEEKCEFKKWGEVLISFESSKHTIDVPAIAVGQEDNFLHVVFSGNHEKLKERFYLIEGVLDSHIELEEDPEAAWECLDENGYLELLEEGLLKTVKDDCIKSWKEEIEDNKSLFPVAKEEGSPIGTIASIKTGEKHWMPHSLAAKVDSRYLEVTSKLYQSWPSYILSQAEPSWCSTWYDSDKRWHNRFYEVFIKEHQDSANLTTFVRHWFWAPEFDNNLNNKTDYKLVNYSDLDELSIKKIHKMWSDRYGKTAHRSPMLQLKEEQYYMFEHYPLIILSGEEIVGVIIFYLGKKEFNPFSILNSAHINIFDENIYNAKGSLSEIINITRYHLYNKNKIRGAITVDFNAPLSEFDNTEFRYFCKAKCLSFGSIFLPSLMSNNSLCFTDMLHRKRSA